MPKYDLDFQPAQRRHRDQVTRILLGFGAILLLLVIASAFALQRDGFIDNLFSQTTVPETTEEGAWTHTGSAVFLLAAHDNAAQNLHFAMLARIDIQQRGIEIIPLNPNEASLVKALREGGARGLQTAAEALTETRVDRYIAGSDNAFVRAVNTMGSVTVQSEGIRHRSPEFTLTLAQGTQRLQGDMLLRYFRYLGTFDEDPPLRQGGLLKLVLETYLVPRHAETDDMLENRFTTLENLLETNISVSDFYSQLNMLMDLLADSGQIVIDVKDYK